MANLVEAAKEQISSLINAAAARAFENAAELRGTVEIPKDTANGDFAANHAMAGARALRMAPRKIADAIVAKLELAGSYFVSAEAAGPGFINFRLAPEWYGAVLAAVETEGADYGRSARLAGQRIMVEFVSANPTGPMHMGNARGGVLGDTLAEVLSRAGAGVWREFYVNDAGNQIEKFATSIDARYRQLILGESAVEFPEDGYHGDDIRELAAAFRERYGDAYLDRPEAERHRAMADFGLEINLPRMKADLERYGIRYDEWFRESSLHDGGYVKDTVDELTRLGHTYEKDGALWLATSKIIADKMRAAGRSEKDIEKLDLKDDVLCRANGIPTYFAADIAYHRNKLAVRGFDKAINIWGADHHGHVARLTAALDALGLDGEHRLVIVLMQLVKLLRDGEVVRMSKRTGKAISLTDLLDEVPRDAARWFFNSRPGQRKPGLLCSVRPRAHLLRHTQPRRGRALRPRARGDRPRRAGCPAGARAHKAAGRPAGRDTAQRRGPRPEPHKPLRHGARRALPPLLQRLPHKGRGGGHTQGEAASGRRRAHGALHLPRHPRRYRAGAHVSAKSSPRRA